MNDHVNITTDIGIMDLNVTLRDNFPPSFTDKSTSADKRDKKRWKRSNHMFLMIMRKTILKAFGSIMFEMTTTVKMFF